MIDFSELSKVAEYKDGELSWFEDRDINAVYVILIGNEYYIGSSHYTYLRIGQHLGDLIKGHHHSCKLQEKFDELQEFSVYILERGIEKSKLKFVEFKYIQKYNPSLNIAFAKTRKTRLRLRELLCEKGITSASFAELVGMHKTNVSNIINGKQMPPLNTIEYFAKVLGCNIVDMFTEDESPSTPQTPTFICPHCGKPLNVVVQKKEKDLD